MVSELRLARAGRFAFSGMSSPSLLVPTPGIRAFGAFDGLNRMIALTWAEREAIESFNDAVNEARETWCDYFDAEEPFSGDNLDEYLTNYRAV